MTFVSICGSTQLNQLFRSILAVITALTKPIP
jgi:hypothetical protein